MKAFILALLPGLEEETGEFFDQVRKTWFPTAPERQVLMLTKQ
jgi:NTP pyrophosphatase (non-canonical NTP hydrolase)